MYALTTIMFTDDECRILKSASLALRVAFPGPPFDRLYDDLPRPMDDEEAIRLGNSLARPGDIVARDRLERAVEVYEFTRACCGRETDERFWFSQVVGEPTEQTRQITDAIVTARRRFVADVDAALALLRTALGEASPKPERSKWRLDDEFDDGEIGDVIRIQPEHAS